jgi:Ohr subfamily peroxiredoxin
MKNTYTARANSVGGRSGLVRTHDGALSFKLSRDGEGNHRTGTNPEELFACGYASCFGTAVETAARKMGLGLMPIAVNSSIDFNQETEEHATISVTLDVMLPSLDQATAEKLVAAAHDICPYSKATQGNIDVTLRTNEQIQRDANFVQAKSFA